MEILAGIWIAWLLGMYVVTLVLCVVRADMKDLRVISIIVFWFLWVPAFVIFLFILTLKWIYLFLFKGE